MQTKLSVITFNTFGIPFFTSAKKRYSIFSTELNNINADIVCLQEVHSYELLDILKNNLNNYPYCAYSDSMFRPKGGLVIFSKYPFKSTTYHYFNKSKLFNYYLDMFVKGSLFVNLYDLPISIINTHLIANTSNDWTGKSKIYQKQLIQINSLILTLNSLKNYGNEIVLTGDFNIAKGSELYRYFVQKSVATDLFENNDAQTFHKEFLKNNAKAHCIDYIFFIKSNFDLKVIESKYLFQDKVEIQKDSYSYLSDHVSLLSELVVY